MLVQIVKLPLVGSSWSIILGRPSGCDPTVRYTCHERGNLVLKYAGKGRAPVHQTISPLFPPYLICTLASMVGEEDLCLFAPPLRLLLLLAGDEAPRLRAPFLLLGVLVEVSSTLLFDSPAGLKYLDRNCWDMCRTLSSGGEERGEQ